MKTILLLFLLHAVDGLSGRILGDVVVEEPQQFPWDLVIPVGIILIVIILTVVLWIRKIKHKTPDEKS